MAGGHVGHVDSCCIPFGMRYVVGMKTETKAAKYSNSSTRNQARTGGKFAKHHRCEACGKNAGDDYASHQWLNEAPFNGRGLVLCFPCEAKMDTKEIAAKMLGLQVSE